MMISHRLWITVSYGYFVLVALIGCALRVFPFVDFIPFDYRNLIHSHSHVAMLGWVFNMLMLAIVSYFTSHEFQSKRSFIILFWSIQASVIGMFVSFILQGYALWSITFSTVHILLTYWLILMVLRNFRLHSQSMQIAEKFLVVSLIFLLLSSLGPWGLAVLGAKGLAGTPLYKSAIYWFLHFTYNGWMTMMLLAAWVKLMERFQTIRSIKWLHSGLYTLALTIPLSFVLSLYEFGLESYWHVLGIAVGMAQIFGVICILLASDWRQFKKVSMLNPFLRKMLLFAFIMLLGKVLFQVVSAIPLFQSIAFFNRDILIFYLHWVLIGWVSTGCIALGFHIIGDRITSLIKTGVYLMIIGFLAQEFILSTKPLIKSTEFVYRSGLLISAIIIMIGVVTLFLNNLRPFITNNPSK